MTSIAEFIAELGKNADFKLDRVDLESLLQNVDFDPAVKQAIINRDKNAIEMLLNARTKIVCLLVPAEPDDDEDDSDEISNRPSKISRIA